MRRTRKNRQPRRAGALVKTVLLVLAAPWLLYLLIANILLMTPVLQHGISFRPRRVLMTWSHAWTVLPGRVHVSDFYLRYQDRVVAFELEVDRAITQVTLSDLFTKKFHTTNTEAEGVAFRLVNKVEEDQAFAPRTLALPVMRGVRWPPVKGDPRLPRTRREQNALWTVDMEDNHAQVRELSVNEYRWRGEGVAEGDFVIALTKAVQVTPATLRLRTGVLDVQNQRISSHFGAHAGVDLPMVAIPPPLDDKLKMLRALSVDLTLDAPLEDLSFAAVYLPGLELEGRGQLAIDAHLDHGQLTQGTHVGLKLATLSGGLEGKSFDGVASVRGWVDGRVPSVRAAVRGVAHVQGVELELERTQADVLMDSNDLSEPWDTKWVRVHAPELRVEDTDPLLELTKGKVPFFIRPLLKGPAVATGVTAEGRTPQTLEVSVEDAHWGHAHARGAAKVNGKEADGAFAARLAFIPFGVKVDDGKPKVKVFKQNQWLDRELSDLELESPQRAGRRPR